MIFGHSFAAHANDSAAVRHSFRVHARPVGTQSSAQLAPHVDADQRLSYGPPAGADCDEAGEQERSRGARQTDGEPCGVDHLRLTGGLASVLGLAGSHGHTGTALMRFRPGGGLGNESLLETRAALVRLLSNVRTDRVRRGVVMPPGVTVPSLSDGNAFFEKMLVSQRVNLPLHVHWPGRPQLSLLPLRMA